ncbi:MAG: RluA family pseudouridine synthase [Peptoniphilus sp.]|nr:RluA family pseudouridine synthase [Peptoniphilus sp.]MDD7363242.1 RluA family pseudouridine synthase [Bacillota bacterium]MDY6045335.1 RluA family pseudouridine synthase [Peptoniphilus sp.]
MKFHTRRPYSRAEAFLRSCGFSNTLMKRLFRAGCITCGGIPLHKSTPLDPFEEVAVDFLDEENRLKKEPLRQEIIYEDDDLLVLNKGVIPSMPCRMYPEHTLANEIAGHFASIGLARKVRMLGRLDRETTGLLVACKNPYAHQKLLAEHTQNKRYLAIVRGRLEEAGTIDRAMGTGEESLVRVVREDGQAAVTHYRPLKVAENTLVELKLETGRCHQIRCHMASIGHPIAGDALYGGGEGALKLHVHKMYLTHPRTEETLCLKAPVAESFRDEGERA